MPRTEGCEAQAAQLRPLTLSNRRQILVTTAFGESLQRIVVALTHPAQRGSVRGRKVLAKVLETQLALEEAAALGMEPCALMLFDVAAAFPSGEWEWIWRCLDDTGVREWSSLGLRSTCDNTKMTSLFNGAAFCDITLVGVATRH